MEQKRNYINLKIVIKPRDFKKKGLIVNTHLSKILSLIRDSGK